MDRKFFSFLPGILRRLFLAWLCGTVVAYFGLPGELRELKTLDGLKEMSFLWMAGITAAVFFVLCLLDMKRNVPRRGRLHGGGILMENLQRYALFFLFAVLSTAALFASFSPSFLGGVLLADGILGGYALWGWKKEDKPEFSKPERCVPGLLTVGILAFLFFVFLSVWTVFRVLTFSAPSFDFGIFSQMFYHMKATGLPNTTIERDGLLSHFKVHVSPVYYLMLPFYFLFPSPITLQILQAAVIASAVIPAWKLVRGHGFSPLSSVLLCVLLLLYPAFAGGVSYDLHENVFLLPLLLWLFYAIDSRKGWMTAIFGILVLSVKEDAAVYTAVIGLWLLLRSLLHRDARRRFGLLLGGLLFAGALLWFLLATGYLAAYGDGVMTGRYDNLMYDGSSSLVTVVKATILSPMKVLYECTDPEKLLFIALTLLPFSGLPLCTRNYERFILLIPYVLVNLVSDYRYQHDIFFQYTYGSCGCLFYLTVLNYRDISGRVKNSFLKYAPLFLAVGISAVCFGVNVVPKAVRYPARYFHNVTHYEEIANLLETIPDGASVAATTFYTVPLSGRKVLHDIRYSSREHLLDAEYVVLSVSDKASYTNYATKEDLSDGYKNLITLLEENGYQQIAGFEDNLVVYRKDSNSGL